MRPSLPPSFLPLLVVEPGLTPPSPAHAHAHGLALSFHRLDVARETYRENESDAYQLGDALRAAFDLESFQMVQAGGGGAGGGGAFVFVVSKEEWEDKKGDLARSVTNVVRPSSALSGEGCRCYNQLTKGLTSRRSKARRSSSRHSSSRSATPASVRQSKRSSSCRASSSFCARRLCELTVISAGAQGGGPRGHVRRDQGPPRLPLQGCRSHRQARHDRFVRPFVPRSRFDEA